MKLIQDYPQFPQPERNPLPDGSFPKMPITELMEYYDSLTEMGLYVLPKSRMAKIPPKHYWMKNEGEFINTLDTREEAYQWQLKDTISGWCVVTGRVSQRLVVVDLDTHEIDKHGLDPVRLYGRIQGMSPSDFVLRTPANGVHIYYRLPDDWDMLPNINGTVVKGMDVRSDGGQVVSLGGYNRYDDKKAEDKGVVDGHCLPYAYLPDGSYDCVPLMTEELYKWLQQAPKTRRNKTLEEANNYSQTEVGKQRIDAHSTQPLDDKVRIVLECLEFVFEQWTDDKYYEEWLAVWMAAHHGSDGSPIVRDYILTHPNIYWRDGEDGRRHFKRAWDVHTHREEDGITVATLFWLAKLSGWMTATGYEIPDKLTTTINYPYVSHWVDTLEDIPNRLLLMSQTGTGKTYNIKNLWLRLDKPKTVIFVPSIKLATELCMTLQSVHGLDATLYRDNDTGDTRGVETLSKAHILVTTLQTFATKVHTPMSEYGLVYVEESDQLLSQFARGGGGVYGSHVSEREARKGYAVIRDAMENSGVVWFVDATMTSITYSVAEATRSSHSIEIVRNRYIKNKAPVHVVDEKGMAYQAVLQALERGKRVVVAADTAKTAEEIVDTMKMVGVLDGKTHLTVIRKTERKPEVVRFMTDVNKYAADYDLISYNSVMASGVSITDVNPDLIVQICTYLSPRVNLQMLNRYRSQTKVILYYRKGENLYAKKASELLDEARNRAVLESQLINIPLVTRTSDAELRAYITALSVADIGQQERSPRDFYVSLLEGDGRKVHYAQGTPLSGVLEHTIAGIREVYKELKDQIRSTWHMIAPVDKDRPALPEYTNLQVAMGETHAEIEKALKGNIPSLDEYTPEYVYDVVNQFKRVAGLLDAFIRQEQALRRAELFLADRQRAVTTILSNVTAVKCLSLVGIIYPDFSEPVSSDAIELRSAEFMKRLTLDKSSYDAMTYRSRQKFDIVFDKYDDTVDRALAFSKILLSRIGLKQRKHLINRKGGEATYHYVVDNYDDAIQFLTWRNADIEDYEPAISTQTDTIDTIINSRHEAMEVFKGMPEEQQNRVMALLVDVDLQVAVTVTLDETKGTW